MAEASHDRQEVDLITFAEYGEHDVDEEPVLVLPCGHILGWQSLDGIMELQDVYQIDMPSGADFSYLSSGVRKNQLRQLNVALLLVSKLQSFLLELSFGVFASAHDAHFAGESPRGLAGLHD
jgi:hypothetical protein